MWIWSLLVFVIPLLQTSYITKYKDVMDNKFCKIREQSNYREREAVNTAFFIK